MQVFDWVNANSGFFQALFTLGLVIATVGLFIATNRYRKATEELANKTDDYTRATKRSAHATEKMCRSMDWSSQISEKLLRAEKIRFVGSMFEIMQNARYGMYNQIINELGDGVFVRFTQVFIRVMREILQDLEEEYSPGDTEGDTESR